MRTFAAVARLGSFAAAAEELSISNAMCSKYVRDLESRLDARLLNRSTRQLSLTEVGREYLQRVSVILNEVDEAEQYVSEMQHNPTGTLRLMAPPSFGSFHISRAVKGYKETYPDIAIELLLSDDFDHMIDLGIDLAFRVGVLEDSSNIALPISSSRLLLCGSPEYLKKNGVPETVDDLKKHVCLSMGDNLVFPTDWKFNVDGKEVQLAIHNRYLKANIADALRVAAINGSGLTQLPSYMVGLDIQSKKLCPLLEEYEPAPLPINMIYAHRTHMSLKVRTFVDYMKQFFGDEPYWDQWVY